MWLIKLRLRAKTHQQATAMAILGLFILIFTAPFIFFGTTDLTGGTGNLDFAALVSGLPWQIMLTALLLALVWLLDWWDITLVTARMQNWAIKPLFATLIYPLVGIVTFSLFLFNAEAAQNPLGILGMVLALNFFVGLSEEVLFRGFVFGALRHRHSLATAIIVSSIAFGALHLVNAGVGQGLSETLFQMLNATALGVLFCSLVLQGHSLWPAILLHMIWNSYAMMGVASAEFMGNVPGTAVEAPDLSPWSLLLPGIITLIAVAVLYQYCSRTGHRLTAVVPVTGPQG